MQLEKLQVNKGTRQTTIKTDTIATNSKDENNNGLAKSREILMFVCLLKYAKQCSGITRPVVLFVFFFHNWRSRGFMVDEVTLR